MSSARKVTVKFSQFCRLFVPGVILAAACGATPISLGSLSWESAIVGGVHSGNFAVQILSNHHDLVGEVSDYVEVTKAELKVQFDDLTEALLPLALGNSPASVGSSTSTLQPQANYASSHLDYYSQFFYNPAAKIMVGATFSFTVNHPAPGPWQLVDTTLFTPEKADWVVTLGPKFGDPTLPYDGQKIIQSLDITAAVPEPAGALLVATGLALVALVSRFRRRA